VLSTVSDNRALIRALRVEKGWGSAYNVRDNGNAVLWTI